MNVPVGRAGYAAVYINDMFRGVYVMLEEVYKKPFLESRFGNKDGAFCKDSTCEVNFISIFSKIKIPA